MELLPRITCRTVAAAIRLAGAGQASSLPGKIANTLFPGYIRDHARRLGEGVALISGTNGKTTSANMTARILADAGRDFVHNSEGANLLSGIATAFARRPRARFALLEVDEAIVPPAIARLGTPRAIVLTNLFRDQLDRYGEVDRLAAGWLAALRGLGDCALVANADDPLVAHVALESGLPTLFFGVEAQAGHADREVSDVILCPRCAGLLVYTTRWLSQLGEYTCPQCGFARPPRDLAAAAIDVGEERATAELQGEAYSGRLDLRVPGLHNIYNALAALGLAARLGLAPAAAVASLARYQPVFGRWSHVRLDGATVKVNLVKNPAGMNQTLRTLRGVPGEKALVFILNDNIADGRDISWIWDVDMEELLPPARHIVACGTRRHEMALRLRYAGAPATAIDTAEDLGAALALLKQRGTDSIFVLPTYTALKEVRRTLAHAEPVSAP